MPFTVSHAAAVVPLRRFAAGSGLFSAMVIGSMSPDIAYFLPYVTIDRDASHSLYGLFWFCIPAGVAVWYIHHLLLAPVLVAVLPRAVRMRLPARLANGRLPRAAVFSVAIAVAVGALTHLIWDSFTHRGDFTVRHIPPLQELLMTVGGARLYVFEALQHLSTIVGGLLLAYWSARWFASTSEKDGRRWQPPSWLVRGSIVMLVAIPLATAIIAAVENFPVRPTPPNLRYAASPVVIYSGQALLAVWLVLGGVYRALIRQPAA